MVLTDKQNKAVKKLTSVDKTNDFYWDEASGAVKFIKGELSKSSSEAGRVVKLDIPMDISHTWIGDLRVVLISPSGVEIVCLNKSSSGCWLFFIFTDIQKNIQ